MARQEDTILLTGPVGNLSFYKTKGGYFVRKKSGVSGDRIKSEPAYARTRENIAEFGRASLATKLFRSAFSPLVQCAADNRVSSRLTGRMVKVIQGDAVNARGQRNVRRGETSLLEGFQFNKNSSLTKSFSAPFTASIDRGTGEMVIDIPAFDAAEVISGPEGATHFCLPAGGAAIDFEGKKYSAAMCGTADMPVDGMQGSLQLNVTVAPGSGDPMFLVFGVEFLQVVNGRRYPLRDARCNAMAIVRVDGRAEPAVISNNDTSAIRRAFAVFAKMPLRDRKSLRFSWKRLQHLRTGSAARNQDSLDRLTRTRSIRTRAG